MLSQDPFYEVGDFWNHPQRWDGVDPHKTCFWMIERGPMPLWNNWTMRWESRRDMLLTPANG